MYSSSVLVLALTGLSSATYWAKNINYRSPSEHHPSLGVSIHKVVKRNDPQSPWDPAQLNFTHGVASGDPYSDSVILWTRISPTSDNDQSNITVSGYVPLYNHETQQYVSVSKAPVCVDYTVATDESLSDVVDSGTAYTSSDIDYTVKVSYHTNWRLLEMIPVLMSLCRSRPRIWSHTRGTIISLRSATPRIRAHWAGQRLRQRQTTM